MEWVKHWGDNAEEIQFRAVTDGTPEDNTYSKYTPSADFRMTVTNPNLHGKFKPGMKFYVDLTEAPQ